MSTLRFVLRIAWRVVFYAAALLSLGICVGASYLWVRSHRVSDRWGYAVVRPAPEGTRVDDCYAWSARGAVLLQFTQTWNTRSLNDGWPFYHRTDGMMVRPYISAAGPGVPERRSALGPIVWHRVDRDRQHLWADFGYGRVYLADRQVERTAIVPYWLVAALTLLLPALAGWRLGRHLFWTRRRRRRKRLGLCVRCGYDLRSGPQPDSARLARCPECGLETAEPSRRNHIAPVSRSS